METCTTSQTSLCQKDTALSSDTINTAPVLSNPSDLITCKIEEEEDISLSNDIEIAKDVIPNSSELIASKSWEEEDKSLANETETAKYVIPNSPELIASKSWEEEDKSLANDTETAKYVIPNSPELIACKIGKEEDKSLANDTELANVVLPNSPELIACKSLEEVDKSLSGDIQTAKDVIPNSPVENELTDDVSYPAAYSPDSNWSYESRRMKIINSNRHVLLAQTGLSLSITTNKSSAVTTTEKKAGSSRPMKRSNRYSSDSSSLSDDTPPEKITRLNRRSESSDIRRSARHAGRESKVSYVLSDDEDVDEKVKDDKDWTMADISTPPNESNSKLQLETATATATDKLQSQESVEKTTTSMTILKPNPGVAHNAQLLSSSNKKRISNVQFYCAKKTLPNSKSVSTLCEKFDDVRLTKMVSACSTLESDAPKKLSLPAFRDEYLSVLKHKFTLDVLTNRIFSLSLDVSHPLLGLAGDTAGNVAIFSSTDTSCDSLSDHIVFRAHSGAVSKMIFDKGVFVSSSYDGTCRRFDLETQKYTDQYKTPGKCTSLDQLSEYTYIVGKDDGSVVVFDIRNGLSTNSKTFSCGSSIVSSVCVHPTQHSYILTANQKGLVSLWDIRSCVTFSGNGRSMQGWVTKFEHTKSVNSACWSYDGNYMLSNTSDEIRLYNCDRLSKIKLHKSRFMNNRPSRLMSNMRPCFHPSRSDVVIYSNSSEPDITVTDSSGMDTVATLSGPDKSCYSQFAFHPAKPFAIASTIHGGIHIYSN